MQLQIYVPLVTNVYNHQHLLATRLPNGSDKLDHKVIARCLGLYEEVKVHVCMVSQLWD